MWSVCITTYHIIVISKAGSRRTSPRYDVSGRTHEGLSGCASVAAGCDTERTVPLWEAEADLLI